MPAPGIGLPGQGGNGVTRVQKRLALLALIAAELVGAALVLRWAFDSYGEGHTLQVWVGENLPGAVAEEIEGWMSGRAGALARAESADADVTVSWQRLPGARCLAENVLVPVDRFPSLRENVSSDELRRVWLGHPRPEDAVSHLFVSAETAAAMDALFGPHAAEGPVVIVSGNELSSRLWEEPGALAVVPFDQLEPCQKALAVDGMSALDRDLNLRRYPLLAQIWIDGPDRLASALIDEVRAGGLDTNRQADHLTVLVMTGVTALTRHVALEMEARNDPAWPARRIAGLLSAGDLTHVSNEVSFLPGCLAQAETTAFCARPEYLETLRLIGADLVELTGNHNLDFGPEYALQSLDLYAEVGMHTFGGGRNAAEAHRPLFVSHNGNRLAFLGYNSFGPSYAWATEASPGAARFSQEALEADLAQARAQADLVFVSVQYTETYSTAPLAVQVADFRAVVDAGADVVTGSQAHQPQAMEFYGGKPVFYGLGNLFFDQTWSDATREGLAVRHFIYEGRLIATQLIPTVTGDNCQTVPAKGDEGRAILETVFAASGW
jgi:poly-gamma-glutamate capsule biosynthesis protein CapA/YwtB (metallophosphatase superfamily)